ncbi:MAG: ketose-bisphosphate aldolase [Alphaproteobacteria bacterium]|nr:ketose-bisphosphate aldolase [Alphaproteobacteria bacterium]
MLYEKFGLVNTTKMFAQAMAHRYAVGAFNFYNMETLVAISSAARDMRSPIILAVSESALEYMGDDMLMAMITGLKLSPHEQIALHLDHGHSFESCAHALDIGFSSVMIDASTLSFDENLALSARVAKYAHAHGATVEAELGIIGGHEDENTHATNQIYTNQNDAVEFIARTGIDSLAIAIGTTHGAYKRHSDFEQLRFDILREISYRLPGFPLVLHGASNIPRILVDTINENGGDINTARGIPTEQLRQAILMGICKINVDSDSRLAFTAGVRLEMSENPNEFNPRKYLGLGQSAVYENTIAEITNIMDSANRLR